MRNRTNRQHNEPIVLLDGKVEKLERQDIRVSIEESRNEDWLQKLIFENPNLLPLEEIEPAFLDPIPLCRELSTGVGPLDILFVNERGMLTLVECKLLKNPEGRREVVGQILDYAQEISRWDFDDLNSAVAKQGAGIIEQVKNHLPEDEFDEAKFIDWVTMNLKRGRFLLLIVGDGIRESVEDISEYLQEHASLNFSFALIEQAMHRLPDRMGGGLLVQPRTICRTVEIERAIVRIEGKGERVEVLSSSPLKIRGSSSSSENKSTISEQDFFERLEKATTPEIQVETRDLLQELRSLGLKIEPSRQGMMIKTIEKDFVQTENGSPTPFNFIQFLHNGKVDFKGYTGELGAEYKNELASFNESWKYFGERENDFTRYVRLESGELIEISDFLRVKKQWLDLVESSLKNWRNNQG